MYQLETACTIQVKALGMGRPIHPASAESFDKVSALRPQIRQGASIGWTALLRKLDRLAPGWDT